MPSNDFQQLFDSVEDLIKRVADLDSPEIQKIRAKVRIALLATKSALHDVGTQLQLTLQRTVESADDTVRLYPWQTVGVATLVGVATGLLVERGRDRT